MPRKCHVCLVAVLLQVILVLWYFSSKSYPRNSVLRRLQYDPNLDVGPALLHIVDDLTLDVFKWYGAEVCIKEGSNITASSGEKCVCKTGWGGRRCGLPQSVLSREWMTEPKLVAGLHVSKRPRRVVVFISDFFHDSRMLELNARILGDLVDVFVVGEEEAKYEQRNQSLVHMLQNGFLQSYHNKLVFVNITEPLLLPIDKLHFTVERGLELLSDLRTDDIFLFVSAEHVLSRDFVLFLKLFHNYPEPVRCSFKQLIYNFLWTLPNGRQDNVYKKEADDINPAESLRENTGKSLSPPQQNSALGVSNSGHELQFDNAHFSRLYSDRVNDDPNLENLPSICAISVHVFSNIFENKVKRLHHENLLLKNHHLEFFNALSRPIFPWNYQNAGWRCHFCLSSSMEIYHKLKKLPETVRPLWLSDLSHHQDAMLDHIEQLKKKGQSEYSEEADRSLTSGMELLPQDLPSYVLEHRTQYHELLSF
ncbi:hypothetical protein FHG87_008243 [Trinorchestia longiramus]|nr:hypothetical protein FHG87_008243 [Trinorchestia longiramus]